MIHAMEMKQHFSFRVDGFCLQFYFGATVYVNVTSNNSVIMFFNAIFPWENKHRNEGNI